MVRKVHGSWWVDFSYRCKRVRKRSPDNSKAGARVFESMLRQKLASGQPIDDTPVIKDTKTFGDFSEDWFEKYVKTNNKPSVRRSTGQILRMHLMPAFGKLKLNQITAATIEGYKAEMKARLSEKTVNNHLAALKSCLMRAKEWGEIADVPAFKWIKVREKSVDYLTFEESDALTEAAEPKPWRLMILTGLRTGLRMGELIGLRWEDINFLRGQITVQRSIVRGDISSPKNYKIRHVPLADDLHSELIVKREKTGYIFTKNGKDPVTRGEAWRALQTACKRAELRPVGWHALRHSFASQLVSSGISLFIVQQLLGHSSPTMTMRYAHLAPSALKDAVAVLTYRDEMETGNFRQQSVNSNGFQPVFESLPESTRPVISARVSKKQSRD